MAAISLTIRHLWYNPRSFFERGLLHIRPGGKRAGHPISEFSGEGLVLLVKRGDREIIPGGSTVLEAGDQLVILKDR